MSTLITVDTLITFAYQGLQKEALTRVLQPLSLQELRQKAESCLRDCAALRKRRVRDPFLAEMIKRTATGRASTVRSQLRTDNRESFLLALVDLAFWLSAINRVQVVCDLK